ncbi:MAG: stage II sporulation protein M [Candidatus Hydrogenedentes bacterium]|nr:stage II sporulation protein M [Candidatus Hydrogenedentota bacterium]
MDDSDASIAPRTPVNELRAPSSARAALRGPVYLLALAVTVLSALGWMERRAEEQQPWSHAILATEGEPLWDGTRPIHVRTLPQDSLAPFDQILASALDSPEIRAQLPTDIPSITEKLVGITLTGDEWGPLLASGRPPRPGANEAVAGDFTHLSAITVGGETYQVTGRLQRGVAGLTTSYVVSFEDHKELFAESTGATTGWIDPNGVDRMQASDMPRNEQRQRRLYGGSAPNNPWLTTSAILTLAIMAGAGSMGHIRLFRALGHRPQGLLKPVLEAVNAWPRLFGACHVLFYVCVFAAMLAALEFPRANLLLMEIFRWTFSEGGLSNVGSAYESGNVLYAAWATFQHNFVVATLALAILPSMIFFFSGFALNAFRFCIVGLGMSPIIAGSVTHFSYHSITMVLELEAYIVASFFIVLWPVQLFRGVTSGNIGAEWRKGLAIVSSGTVLVGIMLAIAAVYEATTIILFR